MIKTKLFRKRGGPDEAMSVDSARKQHLLALSAIGRRSRVREFASPRVRGQAGLQQCLMACRRTASPCMGGHTASPCSGLSWCAAGGEVTVGAACAGCSCVLCAIEPSTVAPGLGLWV
jgi:hypothetical protein